MTVETKQKIKKISGIVANVLIWMFVIFSLVITIMVFAAQGNKDGVPSLFGKSFITIETESMEPVYEAGDLVYLTKLTDAEKKALVKDQIITYHAPIDINGDGQIGDLNTHRIESHDVNTAKIVTKGDNNDQADAYTISYGDIVGVCTEDGKIGGIGSVISFLRSSLGFFLCIVLPLILFFIYELYRFIALIITERAKRNDEQTKADEEEIKRRAIEEYLREHGENAGAKPSAQSSESTEAAAEETPSTENGETAEDTTNTTENDGAAEDAEDKEKTE